MTIERHFLGWDRPVVDNVCGFLLPERMAGPVDLSRDLIIVPTRQAGRRLREALALRCEAQGGGLLGVLIEEPSVFLRPVGSVGEEVNATVVRAVWADLLLAIDPTDFPACFPAGLSRRNYTWALSAGELFEQLRGALADGGYTIGEVVRRFGHELEEEARWRELAQLEEQYLARLGDLGLRDPCCDKITSALCPQVPEGVRRVVLAAVPDPSPLVLRALEGLSRRLDVAVLVHAPRQLADCFDRWGRPLPAKWAGRVIEIPEPSHTILMTGGPADQSRRVIEEIAAAAREYGPADLAIGVPDRNVVPFLESDLAAHGISAFDPANRPITEHSLCSLVETFCTLVRDESCRAVHLFLRHPDVLEWLENNSNCDSAVLLGELDECQSRMIPLRLSDLEEGQQRLATKRGRYEQLAMALRFVREQLEKVEKEGFENGVRSLLQMIYSHRGLDVRRAEDDEFRQVAQKINDALLEVTAASRILPRLGRDQKLVLFLHRLRDLTYHRERRTRMVDLEGWLELPWDNAPFMIVTGMNEGYVPAGRLSDVFLPDALCSRLGLRDDAQRFARDAYLLQTLIEQRREAGRIRLIVGKTGPEGEPLRPSRLLFCCGDEDLVQRVELLFAPVRQLRPSPHFSFSFRLNPRRPWEEVAGSPCPPELSITQLTDYLRCPFRFFLRHILGMERTEYLKVAPDAMDFGTLIHRVLRRMSLEQGLKDCADEKRISAFLVTCLKEETERIYGPAPSLPVTVACEVARERLLMAARVQAALVKEGWETIGTELTIGAPLGGVRVVGRIDRVDKNRKTGVIRIVDYKTSDHAKKPAEVHLAGANGETPDYARVVVAGKEKKWNDLQLPLYHHLLCRNRRIAEDGKVELAFFNLPKVVVETGVSVWDDFGPALQEAAERCAEAVVQQIRAGVFWPPRDKVEYDDFDKIFCSDVMAAVDGSGLERLVRSARA